ncbi:SusD family protein [Chitinophaga costaii]|uniref:SusD family protein n=1 Tax=Chitinophaga costaii TaxID=1335309 RepID=A0A1C4AXE2_9BACT|nr:RagB/SusD family nutrient uptake outer membrane protein [Chitinophaga costaii]PUZ26786.1 RagB/SusD family nutrient uptake outer membrane protein [Chitinophaga costaii]SCB99255.1 SusD family protein [Chitinophaga costaii]
MKKIFIAILLIGSLASCKKWLDVKPQTQISADELFNTEDGFKEAINGMYSKMATTDMFGRELSAGQLEAVGQSLYADPLTDNNGYRQSQLYNYKNQSFINRKDSIWKGYYAVIANANNLLEHIDVQKNLFKGVNYNLIKGEALALRGFCHFDVLRLFANTYYNKTDGQGVPYSTKFTRDASPLYKISEVLTMVTKDLTDAKNLLAGIDPIVDKSYKVGYGKVDTATENTDPELFHQFRRTHINYYAVCGELARVYLYAGDYANALSNALEVINANKFPWSAQSDVVNANTQLRDWIMYKEIIFGIYAPNASYSLDQLLGQNTTGLYLPIAGGDNLFEASTSAGGNDLRYKTWVQVQAGATPFYKLMKYYRDGTSNLYDQMVPAIRLSEMYYIAAEATFDQSPSDACNYYNTVRFNRNIGDSLQTTNKDEFLQALTKEARKEFIGEGQIFYMYKRLNMPIISVAGTPIAATPAIMTWPFPDDELTYANR